MFCPNCGTNNPDGSKFCSECGTVFEAGAETAAVTETASQTVDQIIEGINPAQTGEGEKPTVDQIIDGIKPEKTEAAVPEQSASIPEQPAPQEAAPVQPAAPTVPQQPMPQYQQPAYAQPAAPAAPKPPRKPLDPKQKQMLIIGGACGAVLVAFLIVLFAAIIPHAGLKGKLRYTWTCVGSSGWNSSTGVLDLKKKVWTMGKSTYKINKIQTKDNRVAFSCSDITTGFATETETEVFVVAFSPDGKKLYLFDADGYDDGDSPDFVFSRDKKEVAAANLGGGNSGLLW